MAEKKYKKDKLELVKLMKDIEKKVSIVPSLIIDKESKRNILYKIALENLIVIKGFYQNIQTLSHVFEEVYFEKDICIFDPITQKKATLIESYNISIDLPISRIKCGDKFPFMLIFESIQEPSKTLQLIETNNRGVGNILLELKTNKNNVYNIKLTNKNFINKDSCFYKKIKENDDSNLLLDIMEQAKVCQ